MLKRLLLLLFVIYWQNSFAQEAVISKKEMYADFDTLLYQIKNVSPHIAIKKDLWNYDALKQITRLRKNIDTISTPLSFELLVNRVLNSCQDYHTSPMDRSANYRAITNQFKLYLPITYLNGQYVITRSFKNDNIYIPAGSLITDVNEQQIDHFIAGLKSDIVLRYDLHFKKFYSENFYRNLNTELKGEIKLTIKNPSGELIHTLIQTNKRLTFTSPNRDTTQNQVTYWPLKKVLYIKIFVMDEALIPFYRRKIANYSNNNLPITKIIIDVRDNGGGSDNVWQAVFEAILPRKISFPLTIDGYYPNSISKNYLESRNLILDSIRKNDLSWLKKYNLYHYLNHNEELIPTDSTLNFGGKIVVIGNEGIYSSGASAMTIPNARHDDQIYSIGRPTGMFLGAGYSPAIFELSYSKIKYRIEPAIEVTNTKKLKDLMHDQYEYVVPITMKEIYERDAFNGNTLGSVYLQTKDPLVKKALDL